MEDKNKKIGIIALIFALLALTQASAISSVTMNLIAGTGINITQSGDNYTISALPDNTKVNNIVSSGNYTGDGTTDRFIPYSLNRNASKIDIFSETNPSIMGGIINSGKIYNYQTGVFSIVTSHNTTGFFVSENYNLGGNISGSTIGSTEYVDGGGNAGYILYFKITPAITGTFINISLNSQTAAGNLRFAIYNDSANTPNILLNQSSNISAITGWSSNTTILTNVTNGVPIWLGVMSSSNSEKSYNSHTGSFRYQTPYGFGIFPNTASSVASGTTLTFNMYYNIKSTFILYYWAAI